MISTLELTKAASQKEGSHYGATKGSDATEGRWGAGYLARWESALRRAQPGRWADPLGDAIKAARAWLPRTVNGTGHTGPSEFCATSI